jgi:histidinol-phosphate aminotransferase
MVELMTNLGLKAYPSLTNFTLVDLGKPVDSIYRQLLNLGIVVRPLGPWGLPDHLRISVGTSEEIDSVIATLSKVLES